MSKRMLSLIAPLFILIGCYVGIGTFRYWVMVPVDLHDRWAEIQYFVRGIDPFDIVSKKMEVSQEIGWMSEGAGYPPWSYVFALPLVPPISYEVLRFWYFGVMIFSFMITLILLYKLSGGFDFSHRQSLLIAAVAGCNWAIVSGLRWGQYSLPVLAALTIFMFAIKKNRPILGGIALAFAMIKPQVAFLFGFAAIAKRQWKLLLTAIAAVVSAWIGAAVWLGKPMLSLLAEKAQQNAEIGYYYGLFDVIVQSSRHRELWLTISGGLLIIVMTLISLRQSRKSIEYHMAIAAVASTMWTYSNVADSVVLAFLLYYLLVQYLRQDPVDQSAVLLAVSAALVWQPTGISHGIIWFIPLIMRTVWIVAIAAYAASEEPEPMRRMNRIRQI